jgi:hypothetical protein
MSSSLPPYSLEPLSVDQSVRRDDLIAPYERRPWLDYLVASPGVDVRLWAIRGAETTIGYICGGLVRKGPFLLLGSLSSAAERGAWSRRCGWVPYHRLGRRWKLTLHEWRCYI